MGKLTLSAYPKEWRWLFATQLSAMSSCCIFGLSTALERELEARGIALKHVAIIDALVLIGQAFAFVLLVAAAARTLLCRLGRWRESAVRAGAFCIALAVPVIFGRNIASASEGLVFLTVISILGGTTISWFSSYVVFVLFSRNGPTVPPTTPTASAGRHVLVVGEFTFVEQLPGDAPNDRSRCGTGWSRPRAARRPDSDR